MVKLNESVVFIIIITIIIVCSFVFVCTNNNEPPKDTYWRTPRYLADHLIPASDAAPRRLRLRSANLNRLTVPRCPLSTYSCRAF